MKRRILFILFTLGLAVSAVVLAGLASGGPGTDALDGHESESFSLCDSSATVCCDIEIEDPVASIIQTNVNNVHSGYVRTINRYMRLRYIYCPNAIMKGGKIVDISVIRRFQNNRNIFYSVKLSSKYSFMLLCKLLI